MPELEFTGERVIPGLVETNLFNEHFARYRFAARFTENRTVLDAGCGSGYGSALFTNAQLIVAIDFSNDAVQHARAHFALPQTRHAQARCEALPFADSSFHLVAAFEVIEHLTDWQALLTEARRVLRPEGLLFVSTPNKAYYAESRAAAGPNPFHSHEFEYDEFRLALQAVFPNVALWCQNHADGIVFAAEHSLSGELIVEAQGTPESAHFYLAVCSAGTLPPSTDFAWMPESANVLQARERHIGLLKTEVAAKSEWLETLQANHAALQTEHETVVAELERANAWALGLNGQLSEAKQWGKALEAEIARSRAVIQARDLELASFQTWVAELQAERDASIARLDRELSTANTLWAAEVARVEAELQSTHLAYETILATRERELLAEIVRLESESAKLAADYREILTQRDNETAATHAAYREAIANLEAQLTGLHTGYQASYQALEAEMAAIHPVYQATIRQLELESGQRLQYAESLEAELTAATAKLEAELALRQAAAGSKWFRLGQALRVGPNLGPNLESESGK